MKLLPSGVLEHAGEPASSRTIPVPFLPRYRVSRLTALLAITFGVWPVLIYRLFAAGAREQRARRAMPAVT